MKNLTATSNTNFFGVVYFNKIMRGGKICLMPLLLKN